MEQHRAPIEALPIEIVLMILEETPDVATLSAAVATSPVFCRPFRAFEGTITSRIMLRQIDPGVLPEALITIKAATPIPSMTAEYFILRSLYSAPWRLQDMTLYEAVRLAGLHSYVERLGGWFVDYALDQLPVIIPEPALCIPTHSEVCRVQRALYRFEMYCNASKWAGQPVKSEQFCYFFAPWECDQICCINTFLANIMLPSFKDVAEHDIAWGAKKVQYLASLRSEGEVTTLPHLQTIMSRGLEQIYRITRAKSYEDRLQMLNDDRGQPPRPSAFLHALEVSNEPLGGEVEWLSLTPPDTDRVLPKLSDFIDQGGFRVPQFDDPDPGPFDAWVWAYQNDVEEDDLSSKSLRRQLHSWGFVMWDQERLHSDLLINIRASSWWDHVTPFNRGGKIEKFLTMWDSWFLRREVASAGGSGWWSRDDLTRVK